MDIQNNIISRPLSNSLNLYLLDLFSHTNLVRVVKDNAWIAGGFARIVALDEFKLSQSKNHKYIEEYLYSNGDIDIFSSSLSNIKNAYMKFTRGKLYQAAKKVSINDCFELNYDSCFSNNINFPEKKGLDINTPQSLRPYNIQHIKLQFVNKFFYKNIKECFNNFDFTNCKYALTFSNKKFILHYDKEAVKFDTIKALNLEHCNSPLLGNRIVKYLTRKKFLDGLYESERNQKILSSFCLKVLTNDWDKVYEENFYNTLTPENLCLTRLHDIIKLKKEDLILFLGKITMSSTKYHNGGYGHYSYTETRNYDWALDVMSG
jgi:hypothetical protein